MCGEQSEDCVINDEILAYDITMADYECFCRTRSAVLVWIMSRDVWRSRKYMVSEQYVFSLRGYYYEGMTLITGP